MKQLIFLVVLVPMFAADPQGIVVLKSSDLKSFDTSLAARLDDRKAAMEEFGKAGDYATSIIHREADGDAETESNAVLLVIESGQATLANGKTANSKVAVAEGDVVVIPAHLLHQVLVAPGKAVTYLVIRQQQSRRRTRLPLLSLLPAHLARSQRWEPIWAPDFGHASLVRTRPTARSSRATRKCSARASWGRVASGSPKSRRRQ